MTLSTADFHYLRDIIKAESGISLGDEKMYLIESRLLPLARNHDLKDLAELVARVKMDKTLISEIIEAMTTNETSFFRDMKPFQLFESEVIPHLIAKNKSKNIRVWNAACSTGQEPYSLALTVKEKPQLAPGYNFEFVATDIDRSILKKAEEAVYSQFEVQRGLPIMMLMKYFEQQESYGDKWLLKPVIKEMVKFEYLNLLESYESLGTFDMVMCRNVLIYFEQETKADIINRIANCLKPHGVLFLGSAETVTNLSDRFTCLGDTNSIFTLKP